MVLAHNKTGRNSRKDSFLLCKALVHFQQVKCGRDIGASMNDFLVGVPECFNMACSRGCFEWLTGYRNKQKDIERYIPQAKVKMV